MPFAWTAIYLMNIMTGHNSLERDAQSGGQREGREASREKRSRDSSVDKNVDHHHEMSRAASLGMLMSFLFI